MEKLLKKFFEEEIRNYSLAVIEARAIPSVIDGLKPSQRKVLCEGFKIWSGSNKEPLKVYQFCGSVAKNMNYVHGDASLNACITTMCQTFQNPYTLLKGDGQFGSLRVKEAGSPRYVGCSLSEIARVLYKDSDLCETRVEEGKAVEPYVYYPILPVLLLNGSTGIATGFASNILPFDIKNVVDSCKSYIKSVKDGKKWKNKIEITPYIPQWRGTVVKNQEPDKRTGLIKENKWDFLGAYHIDPKAKVRKGYVEVVIDEFSKDKEYDAYEKVLNDLVSNNDNYLSWNSDKVGTDTVYRVVIKDEYISDKSKDEKIRKELCLDSSETLNLSTIDETGKLRIFDTVDDIIRYFCDYRLKVYDVIIPKRIKELESRDIVLKNKVKFITEKNLDKVLKDKKKAEVEEYLEKNKYDKVDGSYAYILSMNFLNRTKEKADEMVAQMEELDKELQKLKASNKYDLFIDAIDEAYSVLKKQVI